MRNNPRNSIGRLLTLVSLALLAGACASGTARQSQAPRTPSHFYGVAGSHLVNIDPTDGAAAALSSSPELADIGALAYDPGLDVFYAIASAATDPRLLAIERLTGEVMTIGPIDLPFDDLTIGEGLAFDPATGRLYAAGGKLHFASDKLLEVDVTTGAATEIAGIRGTAQNDVDAMALAGDVLYVVDAAAKSSALYQVDLGTGIATSMGMSFRGVVTGLAHDAAGQRLIGAVAGSRMLVTIPLSGGEVLTLGPTHDAAELDGAEITALAFAHPVAKPLQDDFESGDLSTWSDQEGGGRPDG